MRLFLLLLLPFVFAGSVPRPSVVERDFGAYFRARQLRGSFLLFDPQANRYTAYNAARCREGFLPASTFKIPNTIIGFETGVIRDTSQVFKWDGVRRTFGTWNRDMTLAEALRVSCVPCYQQVARVVGAKRYQQWLPKLRFGKMVVTAATVDSFWLVGPSRITQFEEIDFLRRLHANELPVSARSQHLTKQLLLLQQTPQYRLYGKTGWTSAGPRRNNGWFVGWLEQTSGPVYFFALNLEPAPGLPADERFTAGRRVITEQILTELGLLKK
ncbi:class D beta-lactamase [Hymenobacter terrenus]|uniref:class D beta-lactamase n=1 Tax=Hymenobacter terrenus TaxID=1629124 RepID=UPI0006190A35|nr:class D beta-lactamase [Hymenobacter terrenus]